MSQQSGSLGSSAAAQALLSILVASACTASRTEPARSPVQDPEGREEDVEPKNHAAVFVGVTDEDSSSSGSVGVEYERHLSPLLGVGVLLEFTPALQERLVTAPAVFFHPVGGLFLAIAPGAVSEDDELHGLVRGSVGWEFELGERFTLAPELNYDLVSGADDALVYGVALGWSF